MIRNTLTNIFLQGDSGGPLMIKKKHDFLLKSEEKYWLIGIVSYDYGCRKSNESEFSEVSIFVRTSYFTRWIYEKLLWGWVNIIYLLVISLTELISVIPICLNLFIFGLNFMVQLWLGFISADVSFDIAL